MGLMSPETLLVFTRYPEPGTTKTRLIPILGPDGAADLFRRMAEHAVEQARVMTTRRDAVVKIYYEGGDLEKMAQWLGDDLIYVQQAAGNLGQRLTQALLESSRPEGSATVIMGTDCPDLSARILWRAFDLLERNDLVLGPAGDGGYYLIGVTRLHEELFQNVSWGTDQVLSTTTAHATRLGLSFSQLELLHDIDRPEDLSRWSRFLNQSHTRL
jgi:rSAM/selenodomain-associated transferase 1